MRSSTHFDEHDGAPSNSMTFQHCGVKAAMDMTQDRRAGTVNYQGTGKAQPVGGNGPGSCSGKTLRATPIDRAKHIT